MVNHGRLTRRGVVTTIGVLGATGMVSAQNHQNANRPTLAVSSPECETLVLDRDDRGPPTEITVDGPTAFTADISRGESLSHEIAPGTYLVETGSPAVVVEPSTVEIAECLPPGIDAWIDCSAGRPLHFHNPIDRDVYVRWRRWDAETGQPGWSIPARTG